MICIDQFMKLSFMTYNAFNIHALQDENRGQAVHIMKVKQRLFFTKAYIFNSVCKE